MEPHTFYANIISGNRVTIRKDLVEEFGLVDGDKLKVTIQRAKRMMKENAVVTERPR